MSGEAVVSEGTVLEQVRARVAALLEETDGVVALRRTEQGTAPHLFKRGDDVAELALAPHYPLATVARLLQSRDPQARLGLVAPGCDARALVEMAKRRQADLSRLHLVGVACNSDEAKACRCAKPSADLAPFPAGELLGTPVPGEADAVAEQYRRMSLPERRQFWRSQFKQCIKCYGCRNTCPECFCEACALEDKLWVEPGRLAPPFPTFHLIRAMHMSTRCVACRQCESACPAHIPLTVLYDLMREDVGSLLHYEPGADVSAMPPVSLTLEEAPLHEGSAKQESGALAATPKGRGARR